MSLEQFLGLSDCSISLSNNRVWRPTISLNEVSGTTKRCDTVNSISCVSESCVLVKKFYPYHAVSYGDVPDAVGEKFLTHIIPSV